MTHENKEKESKVRQTNRESWLNSMAQELKKRVFAKAGLKLDLNTTKISVGYPPKGGASKVGKAIGVCFPKAASDANVNEIFINPCLDKSQVTKVAGVLVHELIHAIDDCRNGHGPVFRKMAIACGLEGKMTATTESAKLKEIINNITKKIGPYPHKKLNYEIGRKKQTTRNLKIECPKCWETGDPYFVRMSRTMFEKAAPKCGVCGTKMVDDVTTAYIFKHLLNKEEWELLGEVVESNISTDGNGLKGYIYHNEYPMKKYKLALDSLSDKGIIKYSLNNSAIKPNTYIAVTDDYQEKVEVHDPNIHSKDEKYLIENTGYRLINVA